MPKPLQAISEVFHDLKGKFTNRSIRHIAEFRGANRYSSLSHESGRSLDLGPGPLCVSGRRTVFNEENGEPLLLQYVSSIEKDVYEDTLQIDNADVVIGYLRSVFASEAAPPGDEFYRKYAEYVARAIREQGAFRVYKRNALYRCRTAS